MYTEQGGNQILTLSKINKLSLSTCKIKIESVGSGTGFLIDLEDIGKGLITCYHVLDIETLKNKKRIKFVFNTQSKELNLKWDKYIRFIFTDETLDITFIELFEEDFDFEICFLKYSIIDNFKNKNILIFQHPAGAEISYAEGQTLDMTNNTINHNVSTLPGSSGSALILKNGENRVIGIHKSGNSYSRLNQATPFTTGLIEKIKDFKTYSYFNDKIFPCIKCEQIRNKFTSLFKFFESNVEGLGIDEEMKEKINKLKNSDKPLELFGELFKNDLIQIEEEQKKFEKALLSDHEFEINKDYLIHHILFNIKNNDSYKNYILINQIKFDDNLNFLKGTNKYCDPCGSDIEMNEVGNFKNYDSMVFYIIVSFWFVNQDKEFFINKALYCLNKLISGERKDLWYDTQYIFVESYLLNEIGKKEESINVLSLCKNKLKQCQEDYNYELRRRNPKCEEYYYDCEIVRRREENFYCATIYNYWIFKQEDIDKLRKIFICYVNHILF